MAYVQEIVAFHLGMHNGKSPRHLGEGEIAEAVNASIRDLEWCARPPAIQCKLDFQAWPKDGQVMREGRWQGMGVYRYGGREELHWQVDGNNFAIDLKTMRVVKKNGETGPANPNVPRVNYQAHDRYLIRQDGQSKALIIDGDIARHPVGSEVPIGFHMASSNGFLAISSQDGTGVNISDYYNPENEKYKPTFLKNAQAPLGDPALTFEDQRTYYLGDTLLVPSNAAELGCVTGLRNIVIGNSLFPRLMVLYENGAWIYDLSIPRHEWVEKAIGQPLPGFPGHTGGQNATVINRGGDLMFRYNGQIMALSDVAGDGTKYENNIMSTPLRGWTDFTATGLEFAGWQTTFDHQLFATAQPRYQSVENSRGRYRQISHRGLYVGDYEHHTDEQMSRGFPRLVWSGLWEYEDRDVLGMVRVNQRGAEHLYIAMLNRKTGENELWKQTPQKFGRMHDGHDRPLDGGPMPIKSTLTMPVHGMQHSTREGSARGELKMVKRFHHWIKFFGECSVTTSYRWDERPAWQEWGKHAYCTTASYCKVALKEICEAAKTKRFRLLGRYLPHLSNLRKKLDKRYGQDAPDCGENKDAATEKPNTIGREIQVKLKLTGSWCWRGSLFEAEKCGDEEDVEKYEEKADMSCKDDPEEEVPCETILGE